MSALLVITVIIGAVLLLDVLAVWFGVDSRPESSDPRSPVRGINS
jgi:hypothetical protein